MFWRESFQLRYRDESPCFTFPCHAIVQRLAFNKGIKRIVVNLAAEVRRITHGKQQGIIDPLPISSNMARLYMGPKNSIFTKHIVGWKTENVLI